MTMKYFQQVILSVILAFIILIVGSMAEPNLASAHVSSRNVSQSSTACTTWYLSSETQAATYKDYSVSITFQVLENGNPGSYCGQVRAIVCFNTVPNNPVGDIVLWQEFYQNNQFVSTQRFYFYVPVGYQTYNWCSTGSPYSVSKNTTVEELAQLQSSNDGSVYLGYVDGFDVI